MLLAAFALVLQLDAVVKSTVMTALAPLAAAETAATGCNDAMPGMTMGRLTAARDTPGHRHGPADAKASCPYCAVAAHAPLVAHAAPLRPSSQVSFAPYRTVAGLGARGPPAFRPRARGPPRLA